MTDDRTGNAIDDQAAAWVIQRDRGLSPMEEQALARWLDVDPRHRGAFLRAEAAWVVAGYRQIVRPSRLQPPPRPAAINPGRRALLAGGGALAACLAAGVLLLQEEGTAFATMRGEVRQVPLEDGSTATLNTDTALSARFSDRRRDIGLERGEAWFDVARDAARPFVVRAGHADVTAVGTAFTVRRAEQWLEVLVTEGRVAVAGRGLEQDLFLAAGQRLILAAGGPPALSSLDPQALERRLAWRTGMIMLDGETLEMAVREFNRYNRRPIQLDGQAIGRERVVGIFRSQDPEGFARAAAAMLGLDMQSDSDAIHLSQRQKL